MCNGRVVLRTAQVNMAVDNTAYINYVENLLVIAYVIAMKNIPGFPDTDI